MTDDKLNFNDVQSCIERAHQMRAQAVRQAMRSLVDWARLRTRAGAPNHA
ncbi:RSP_7527 family protein [Roseobacter sp. HKCCA0434]|nr:hypothetical protein [Roseobacter sp. HKCCA0434]